MALRCANVPPTPIKHRHVCRWAMPMDRSNGSIKIRLPPKVQRALSARSLLSPSRRAHQPVRLRSYHRSPGQLSATELLREARARGRPGAPGRRPRSTGAGMHAEAERVRISRSIGRLFLLVASRSALSSTISCRYPASPWSPTPDTEAPQPSSAAGQQVQPAIKSGGARNRRNNYVTWGQKQGSP
jgi:hypothetical protein